MCMLEIELELALLEEIEVLDEDLEGLVDDVVTLDDGTVVVSSLGDELIVVV